MTASNGLESNPKLHAQRPSTLKTALLQVPTKSKRIHITLHDNRRRSSPL